MFMDKADSEVNFEKPNVVNTAQNIKVQINECLDKAEKRPEMRKKML